MGTKERQLVSREGLLESGDGWLLESTFLTRLSREEVGECLGLMHWLTWSRQDQLTTLGRPRDGIDLIVSGQAVVLAPDEVGKVSPIAHVGCGSLIGERSLVSILTAQPDSGTIQRMRMMLEYSLYRWMANPPEKRLLIN